jgi:peptide methionine sulfoxide reductase msrA/msrB
MPELKKPNKYDTLTPDQRHVICEKGTETPNKGLYTRPGPYEHGTFICRSCGKPLYKGDSKFISHCGWPSFDAEIEGAVLSLPDKDGRRTEILCSRCHGHLGHVFKGENLTDKNMRHCVNSISIDFVESTAVKDTAEIILAAGCFWGVEALFRKEEGVLISECGYIGGHLQNPSYEDICNKSTGHLEAIRVVYDLQKTHLEQILECFFEIHDFSQEDGEGPDIGPQYISAIFTSIDKEILLAKKYISELEKMRYTVFTKILPLSPFWKAEEYHQNYYKKSNKSPYCHIRRKIF